MGYTQRLQSYIYIYIYSIYIYKYIYTYGMEHDLRIYARNVAANWANYRNLPNCGYGPFVTIERELWRSSPESLGRRLHLVAGAHTPGLHGVRIDETGAWHALSPYLPSLPPKTVTVRYITPCLVHQKSNQRISSTSTWKFMLHPPYFTSDGEIIFTVYNYTKNI